MAAAVVEFPVHDSNDRPTDFKEGLPTYLNVTMGDDKKDLELFLLCTTCTISYMFGKPEDFTGIKLVDSSNMVFKSDGEEVKVDFYSAELTVTAVNPEDSSETPYKWTQNIGLISPEFQSNTYFDNFKENMLGLAPMLSNDTNLLDRQFLYKFINGDEQKKLGLLESYAFNGGETFAIGGSV